MLFEETQLQDAPAPVRRRRRLIIDTVTEIPHEECRRMFNDTSAIVNRVCENFCKFECTRLFSILTCYPV